MLKSAGAQRENFPLQEVSTTDHEMKHSTIGPTTTQDDGEGVEAKKKRKEKKKVKGAEEIAVPQGEDTPGK